MKARGSLGRQLALAMVGVSVSMLVLTFAAIYLTYWLIFRYAPSLAGPQDSLMPSSTDFALLAVMSLLALLIGTQVAFRMAVRIVAPVSSVAQAARRVAGGDLTARAHAGDRSLGETAMLADDFNGMAAQLERLAGEVVAWNAQIAHELRTPLQILRGRLQGVSDGVFVMDDALIQSLTKQVDGLSRLVEDLRVVSLFDTGRLALDRQQVDLAHEIEDIADLVRPQLEQMGFSLNLSLDPGLSLVDPIRIRQAIMALVDNARKHANPGELRIGLRIESSGTRIRVGDSGPGLSPEFAASAFDLFSRAEGQVPSTLGSGLGLSVVQAIMEAHGGRAWYDGSRMEFVLELPAN